MTNRVRVGQIYFYHPNLLDRCDARTNLVSGDRVMVKNMTGCPEGTGENIWLTMSGRNGYIQN